MIEKGVAEGIHRIEEAHTNWYLVEEDSSVTVVDAGFPRSWSSLQQALGEIGRGAADVEAVVLTHGHFDHVGFASRARRELAVPIWVPEGESSIVAHPWRYPHERSRIPYLRRPAFVRNFAEMAAMGALWVQGVESHEEYRPGTPLDVPGHPEAIATPGHTPGHCSLSLPDRGAVIVGDAFVMADPYTGRSGPCIVAGAATADSARALSAIESLSGLDADLALTGHGPAWSGDLGEAVQRAQAAGPS